MGEHRCSGRVSSSYYIYSEMTPLILVSKKLPSLEYQKSQYHYHYQILDHLQVEDYEVQFVVYRK